VFGVFQRPEEGKSLADVPVPLRVTQLADVKTPGPSSKAKSDGNAWMDFLWNPLAVVRQSLNSAKAVVGRRARRLHSF
jgi:hypothetical protein